MKRKFRKSMIRLRYLVHTINFIYEIIRIPIMLFKCIQNRIRLRTIYTKILLFQQMYSNTLQDGF